MAQPIPSRYFDVFLRSFTKTWEEILMHMLLGLSTIAYLIETGGWKKGVWDIVVPLVWLLCAEIAFHAIKTGSVLWQQKLDTSPSTILSSAGKPFEVAPATLWPYRAKVIGVTVTMLLLCTLLSFAVGEIPRSLDSLSPKSIAETQPAIVIDANCDPYSLPIAVPPNTSIYVLPLNLEVMLSQQWGLYDVPNHTDREQQWPTKAMMAAVERKYRNQMSRVADGSYGYKCDVHNDSPVTVLDVAIGLTLWYKDQTGSNNEKYSVILSPMASQAHYSFYVFNDCPVNVEAALPDTVTLTVPGELARRQVPLSLPHRSPVLEQVMMFFPSPVQWARQQPC